MVDQYFIMEEDRLQEWLHARWSQCPVEALGVVTLGEQARFLTEELIATGTERGVIWSAELPIRSAVLAGASAIVAWHVHPGDLAPYFSYGDVKAAKMLIEQAKACDIQTMGFYLISRNDTHYVSAEDMAAFDIGNLRIENEGAMARIEGPPGNTYVAYVLAHGAKEAK